MRWILSLSLCVSSLYAQGIPRQEYQKRRADLRKTLDGVMVLFGAVESDDLHAGFFQESSFLYLSGWREPGAVIMLTPKEEIFFVPPRDTHQELYTGRKLGAEDADAVEKTGFAKVLPKAALESQFLRLMETSNRIYTLPGDRDAQKLRALAVFHDSGDAEKALGRLRMIKSPAEIALIEHASDVTVAAHLEAWKKLHAGQYEYQIAAVMTNVYFERGCERSAYMPIVGSGPNSTILHYSSNKRRADAGEVVLMDVGAECSDYATDVTRTVPVSGKFTPRQREIYEIVLGAQKAAIAAVKPGVRIRENLYRIAYDYINTHGKDANGDALGKYFTHGLTHHVGLDVHDLSDNNVPLEAGMVITIEPGVYIPEENIGVRIEDTLLVTPNGAKNLSGALPREVQEIEKLVGK
ncbi:MAG TPA: Xaa-Pro peptidase family protein [Bryobacteraceae bacterium]|nr:Xaa-Pro peptidase family protein [Bryobacteraceae bacterium]